MLGSDDDPEEAETADASFGLEFQLRDFIAQDIGAIDVDGKRLQLYVDPTGRDAIEYPTAVGPIDILAVDNAGAFFVFELKRARSPDHAIGQLTRYMGWGAPDNRKGSTSEQNYRREGNQRSLRYALSVVPNVSLFEYEAEFHLKPAHQLR